LDIGKQFDVNLGNFDHHQQRGLEATNLLVLRNSFIETRLKDKLVTMLFQHVSDVDNGLKGFNESFYSLIRNFNNIANGFNVALEVTKSILEATIATAKKSIEGEARWHSLERVQFVVAINEGEFIPDWQVLADSNNIHFLASPNPRGGWQLTSRNSQEFLLKPSEFQTGIHPNLFIAFYKDKETCLQDAVIQVG
jgi:CRISPR/Cas system CMR-associated protein Cmr5 small subunit